VASTSSTAVRRSYGSSTAPAAQPPSSTSSPRISDHTVEGIAEHAAQPARLLRRRRKLLRSNSGSRGHGGRPWTLKAIGAAGLCLETAMLDARPILCRAAPIRATQQLGLMAWRSSPPASRPPIEGAESQARRWLCSWNVSEPSLGVPRSTLPPGDDQAVERVVPGVRGRAPRDNRLRVHRAHTALQPLVTRHAPGTRQRRLAATSPDATAGVAAPFA
jgi:hypothetical protein